MGKKGLKTKPIILREGKYDNKKLEMLKEKHDIWKKRDIYESQLQEIFRILNASLNSKSNIYKKKLSEFINDRKKPSKKLKGNWVYFPWNGNLIHAVNEEEYFELRTNRNRNLITKSEQKTISAYVVGIVGLSVGNNIATSLAFQGISNTIKLAEADTLETTNLNRMRARIDQIGISKLELCMQQIFEINPYAKIIPFERITEKNITKFIESKPKLDVIFDEIDDFKMKVMIRVYAKKYQIPVLMMTNLGDRVMVDVERYDENPDTLYFNSDNKKLQQEILNKKEISKEDEKRYAINLVGIHNLPQRAIESVKEIGKTLVGRPQLSSTVTISGGIASYLVRRIALKRNLKSGRHIFDLNNLFKD
ncbi:MAG: ThiF family adenylyltransferase [Thermoplasmatales archaeon]|nr:MAG: ThiF family adenylyltransferase [Thermoplasmatales archaeon]